MPNFCYQKHILQTNFYKIFQLRYFLSVVLWECNREGRRVHLRYTNCRSSLRFNSIYIISRLLSLFFVTTSVSLLPLPASSFLSSSFGSWRACNCHDGIDGGTTGRFGLANCFLFSNKPLIDSKSCFKLWISVFSVAE